MAAETPKALIWTDKQVGRVAGLLAVLGGVGIIGLVGITIVAVIWRYGLNDPIFGVSDLSVVTLTIVAGAAVAFGARKNAHVSVNIISFVAARRVSRWTDAIMRTLTVAIAGLATYGLFAKACGFEKACITNNFSIEHWPFYYFLGVSMAVYTLHVLMQLLIGLWHFADNDPNEIAD